VRSVVKQDIMQNQGRRLTSSFIHNHRLSYAWLNCTQK